MPATATAYVEITGMEPLKSFLKECSTAGKYFLAMTPDEVAALPESCAAGVAVFQSAMNDLAARTGNASGQEDAVTECAPVTLARGAGQVTDIDLPAAFGAVALECAGGTAQVLYGFPGEIAQHAILAAELGPRRVEIPAGKDAIRLTRFDDGPAEVTATLLARQTSDE